MSWWDKLKLWFCVRILHWGPCPDCQELRPMQCEQVAIAFPEEPPLFVNVSCKICGWSRGPLPTSLMEKAARDLGYKDFLDFAKQNTPSKD